MAKRYDEPIEVSVDLSGSMGDLGGPISFHWRGRRYDVDERLGSWREAGQWWDPTSAREREYYRVLARPAGSYATGDLDPDGFLMSPAAVYDIYLDRYRGTWRMARLWD